MAVQHTTLAELEQRYHTLLFDAYGVLMNSDSALPGAAELVSHLNRIHKPYLIVSNSSHASTARTARRYAQLGLAIPEKRIITSGGLIQSWAEANGLMGARFALLGPPACWEMHRELGISNLIAPGEGEFDVLVVGNQDGYPFVEYLDAAISALFAAFDGGKRIRLVLPNPDLLYPTSRGYGITGGSVAGIITAALQQRYPQDTPQFEYLGKPYAPIFDEARRRAGTNSLVLIGDQLATDIRGANQAGMSSVLIGTGISKFSELERSKFQPTYILDNLRRR